MYQENFLNKINLNNKSWFNNLQDSLCFSNKGGWTDEFGYKLEKWNRINNKPIKTLSLFTGGGGLDIGFHDAGFQIVEANEINKSFCDTLIANKNLKQNFYNTNIICSDIKDYDPDLKGIEFIIGGPPCQTFSAAGARVAGVKATTDSRGNLFKEYARILNKLKPKGFLFENVYRIVGAKNGESWREIQKVFEDLGYSLFWKILDSSDYGVPQSRERLFIIGINNGEYFFPEPTHGPESLDNKEFYNAKDAVSNLIINADDKKYLHGRHGYLLNDIPPGLNYSFYSKKLGHPNPIFGWRTKFSDYLYKADPNRPVRTIKAQGGQYTGPFSWENRLFTISELKRLQTFPDNYQIIGGRQKIIHQLGNSVPPQIARILGLSISQQIFNKKLPSEINYISSNYEFGFRKRKSQLTRYYSKLAQESYKDIKSNKDNINKEIKIEKNFFISDNLILTECNNDSNCRQIVKIILNTNKWDFSINNKGDYSENIFSIKINLNHELSEVIKTKEIFLNSDIQNKKNITILWKVLEKYLYEISKIDDLVQFFGYYQYKDKYNLDIQLSDNFRKDQFWNIWIKITKGIGVGSIFKLDDLSKEYNHDNKAVYSIFTSLKKLGYEIRNNNTNDQIPVNHYLIPYQFPTLTNRSLQRNREL